MGVDSPGPRRPIAGVRVVLLLCALVVLLNVNGLWGFFVGDDLDILWRVERKDDLLDALTTTYIGNWGPMSYVQFYLNFRLGGLNPLVYHLTNLSWLCLAVVALYAFVRSVWPEAPFAAWSAALLFATHPVHDEAVTHLCGRSHSIATALALLTMLLYARFRLHSASRGRRATYLAGSLLAAFFAGLAKQSALTIPVWIAVFEWLFARDDAEPRRRSVLRAAGGGALFSLAAVATRLLRWAVTSEESPYLLQLGEHDSGGFIERLIEDPPIYALFGALPVPFSWFDLDSLLPLRVVGFGLVLAAMAAGAACFRVNAVGSVRSTKASGIYVFGLVIVLATLTPLMLAGLSVRRRYLFIASAGIVLMAAAALVRLHARFPRGTRALLGVALLAGAAGVIQRNDLYRRSGDAVHGMLETIVGEPLTRELTERERVPGPATVLITLPRMYGGDLISGANMLHWTDLGNALRVLGIRRPVVSYAMRCYHADDYTARASFLDDTTLHLTVTFRSRRAYEMAAARDPRKDRRGRHASAERLSSFAERLEQHYLVRLADGFWQSDDPRLFLYSDGKLTRLQP